MMRMTLSTDDVSIVHEAMKDFCMPGVVTLTFANGMFQSHWAPANSVGYAIIVGDRSGIISYPPPSSIQVVFCMKTHQELYWKGAFDRATADYPTLHWQALAAINNLAVPGGVDAPYLVQTIKFDNVRREISSDIGQAVNSLEQIFVDQFVGE